MILAELVDPFADSLLWSETYEYDQVNEVPFRIYKEISQSIAEHLDIELSSDLKTQLANVVRQIHDFGRLCLIALSILV